MYNVITGNVGAAPLPKGVEATFAAGAIIFDWRRDPLWKPSNGTVSWSTEVPTKKTIKFVTDKERSAQKFGDIYELEDAFVNYANMKAMVFGPAWFEPLKDCGRRLRELPFLRPAPISLDTGCVLGQFGVASLLADERTVSVQSRVHALARAKDHIAAAWFCDASLHTR